MIAIGGVLEGMALDMDDANAADIIGRIGFKPASKARAVAIGQAIMADAVFETE